MKIILLILIVFIASCNHKIDNLNLKFEDYKFDSKKSYIILKSNLDLNSLLYTNKKESLINNYLICPLLGTFSSTKIEDMPYIIRGHDSSRTLNPIYKIKDTFYYQYEIEFCKLNRNDIILNDTLKNLLKKRDSLPCRLILVQNILTTTNTTIFNIPTDLLLKRL